MLFLYDQPITTTTTTITPIRHLCIDRMSEKRIPLFEEDKDYINEDHISEFAKALIWQDDYDYDNSTTTPTNELKIFDTSINDDKEETKQNLN